jgi:hypothetical protein
MIDLVISSTSKNELYVQKYQISELVQSIFEPTSLQNNIK